MVRDVTDKQRSRRPIFNATLRAAASWLFFRVARYGSTFLNALSITPGAWMFEAELNFDLNLQKPSTHGIGDC